MNRFHVKFFVTSLPSTVALSILEGRLCRSEAIVRLYLDCAIGIDQKRYRAWTISSHLEKRYMRDWLPAFGVDLRRNSLVLARSCMWYLALQDFGVDLFSPRSQTVVEAMDDV